MRGLMVDRWCIFILDPSKLAKSKRVSPNTTVQELNGHGVLPNLLRLANQLIQALFGDRANTIGTRVDPMIWTRRRPIEFHVKADGLAVGCRPHHQVPVACTEPEGNAAR